ncbi:neuroendocrine protein 7B2-like [Paramacrobiotus metropolitanus]|uniref:neuroendocrine protein 7B2-like n=1 Tax=Paramacrobiotus metropolitanus TaxID=2943436 RepID=UPI002446366A|nr:neuroendocrine protein 7B2-like [Paramacrobiotus metropolitanus]
MLSVLFFSYLTIAFSPLVYGENINKLQDVLNQLVGHYYQETPEEELLGAMRAPVQDDIIIPSTVLRDEEHLPYNPLWGHQYLSGGAGEGRQFLSPEGTIPNIHQVKTDSVLPAYCDPPNPCPEGYTSADGCFEDVPNTAEFSREYQSQQNCPCDPEHMFDCSVNSGTGMNSVSIDGAHQTVRGKKFHEKKSGDGASHSYNERHPRSVSFANEHIHPKPFAKENPYLQGKALPVIAKKSPLHHKLPRD